MDRSIALSAGDYRAVVEPARGGSLLSLEWRGQDILRPAQGPDILDAACFPLVPWSNRIAKGRFSWRGREISLTPNFPTVDPVSPLHGTGWLSAWDLLEVTDDLARLEHVQPAGEWPWAYRAELAYRLTAQGLTARIELTNLSDDPMPAGLGFHPYLPRTAATRYLGLHHGEWTSGNDGLPLRLELRDIAIDWWAGATVGTRVVDTVYAGRSGDLAVSWPDRNLSVRVACSDNLSFTSVFLPEAADWFCVEPVSHMTDALNRAKERGAMTALMPGEAIDAEMRIEASA